MDDAVRKGFTELSIAIVEQSIRYARGNVACPDGEELETDGCLRCVLRDTCEILKNAPSLIAEAKEWVVEDGVEFMQSMGLNLERGDIEKAI